MATALNGSPSAFELGRYPIPRLVKQNNINVLAYDASIFQETFFRGWKCEVAFQKS